MTTPSTRQGAESLSGAPATAESPPRDRKQDERGPGQADLLVDIVRSKGELFHDPHGAAYVSLCTDGRCRTWKLRSRHARSWMDREFYAVFGRVPGGTAAADALSTLEGIALHGSAERTVHVRTGEHEGRVYIDLGDKTRDFVEVDGRGWRIVARAPVHFVRPAGMAALPRPQPGGRVDELRPFVNVKDDAQFRLVVAWILAAQRPRGPYPILCLQGEQGSSKSTTTRLVRALVDPSVSPIRVIPGCVRDLAINACAAHVLAYDNLSGMPLWLSDALCRVATGGGFATRALHTDDEEVIFEFVRPVVVNGIDDVATRPDLADRCLVVTLPAIPKDKRRRDVDIRAAFEAAAPRIYGAILSALAGALLREPHVQLAELPRMADFAVLATAAESSLGWEDGDFMAAYAANQSDSRAITLDADLVAQTVARFMRDRHAWSGPAKELLEALRRLVSEAERASKAWPSAPNVLSTRLRRAAPILRELGVEVNLDAREGRDGDKRRVVVLRALPPSSPGSPLPPGSSSASSPSSSPGSSPLPEPNFPRGDDGDDGDDVSGRFDSPGGG
ncbi:MAG: hypothetical protein JOZ69_22415 [Myxococcales bacterium]|nr:hypothetical protein [Myxococcales bacterium]